MSLSLTGGNPEVEQELESIQEEVLGYLEENGDREKYEVLRKELSDQFGEDGEFNNLSYEEAINLLVDEEQVARGVEQMDMGDGYIKYVRKID